MSNSDDGQRRDVATAEPAASGTVVNYVAAGREWEEAKQKAEASGSYMLAIWYIADGRLHLFRKTQKFPDADLLLAVDLLRDNLRELSPNV